MRELLSGMEGVEDLLQGTVCMNLSRNEGAGAALVANGNTGNRLRASGLCICYVYPCWLQKSKLGSSTRIC